jgi:hypothetical protein
LEGPTPGLARYLAHAGAEATWERFRRNQDHRHKLVEALVSRFRSFIDYVLTVSGLQGSQAETLDRSENVVSRFGSTKRLGLRIDGGDVVLDSRFEFLGAAMHATPKLFFGQQGKETLHLIQP